jgi:hypothetical protein
MAWLDLMKDIPLSAVIKERLAHEEKLHEETKAKNAELQLQVDELTKEITKLKTELASLKTPDEFVDRNGLFWKKTGEGPYCPRCKGTMGKLGPTMHRCPKCGTFG